MSTSVSTQPRNPLKCRFLSPILVPPDAPDEGGTLAVDGDQLTGAGWTVPIVEGIPDFVSNAPTVRRSLSVSIPISDEPNSDVLQPPPDGGPVPDWFTHDPYQYAVLAAHRRGLLLDAGSGQGSRASFQGLSYDYIGLDVSFNSRQRHQGFADIDIVADCHRMPFPQSTFEVIWSAAVIEHLYCPALFVREAFRTLKPGGLLIGHCAFLEAFHFKSQYHLSHLGLFRLLHGSGLVVQHIWPGQSLWEWHSGSIYFSLPFNTYLGRLHRKIYLALVGVKSKDSPSSRLMRSAAHFHFIAKKPQ
jgi:SAM-dependent methyltransferase